MNTKEKPRLYEATTLTTLYSAEIWPLTATSVNRLDDAYHRQQRSTLGVKQKKGSELQNWTTKLGLHTQRSDMNEQTMLGLEI